MEAPLPFHTCLSRQSLLPFVTEAVRQHFLPFAPPRPGGGGDADMWFEHGDAPLRPGAEAWVLALRVYDRPRPLARRVILPAVLWLPFGGAPPKALAVASYRFFARAVGDEKAPAAVDAALWALAALLFAPLGVAAFLAYKAFEKSRAPPKRVVSQPEKKGKKSKKRD